MKNKVAVAQINSTNDIDLNLRKIEQLVKKAAKKEAKLILLPENCVFIGKNQLDTQSIAENLDDGVIQKQLQKLAIENNIWIIAGSIATIQDGKIYQTCMVYNELGELLEYYNKLHLFDVELPETKQSYRESDTFTAGNSYKVVETPIGKIGLAVCYDLRFPEQFRTLHQLGADIFILPAAFTYETGKAHWEILLKARAIENLSYVLGSGQTGIHANHRRSYGHSMIISPWGKVKKQLEREEGVIVSDISLDRIRTLRSIFPVLNHIK